MQNRSQSSDLVFGTNEWKQKSSWHIILDTSCDRFLAHLEHHPRAKLIDKPFGFLVFFCRCCAWQLVLKSHGLDDSFTNEPRWDCLFARWSLRCTAELSLIFIFFFRRIVTTCAEHPLHAMDHCLFCKNWTNHHTCSYLAVHVAAARPGTHPLQLRSVKISHKSDNDKSAACYHQRLHLLLMH